MNDKIEKQTSSPVNDKIEKQACSPVTDKKERQTCHRVTVKNEADLLGGGSAIVVGNLARQLYQMVALLEDS